MNLTFLIIGVCLCVFSTIVFLVARVKKGGLAGLFTKIIASVCFIMLGMFLSFGKNQIGYYSSLPICLIIIGLVLGLVGDIVLDLKVMYEFHDKQYLNCGMTAFSVAHIFNIAAILTFVNTQISVQNYLIPIAIIAGSCVVLTLVISLISTKILKLNYGKHAVLTNIYCFILLLTTALSIYFTVVLKNYYMIILSVGFVFFLLSDLILSTQYFGGKQDNKKLIILNHATYYLAQILIATFIYFI